jgi:hypothetical protein
MLGIAFICAAATVDAELRRGCLGYASPHVFVVARFATTQKESALSAVAVSQEQRQQAQHPHDFFELRASSASCSSVALSMKDRASPQDYRREVTDKVIELTESGAAATGQEGVGCPPAFDGTACDELAQ